MAEISATLVKELREETNVGMMECKKALLEANGDKAQAIKLLRERGLAIAGKKASRAANSGVLAARTFEAGRTGVLIEVNCETDFVARNENFQKFVGEILDTAGKLEGELAPQVKDAVAAQIAQIGENIVVRRNLKYAVQGTGAVVAYIHLGSKVGVLAELGCTKAETASAASFLDLAKDVTLHIAASNPPYLDRTGVPAAVLASEREIYAKQVQNKPANIVEKIVDGKIGKFFQQACLIEQPFVKDPNVSVTQLLEAKGKELGDTLAIRRFARWTLGEEIRA